MNRILGKIIAILQLVNNQLTTLIRIDAALAEYAANGTLPPLASIIGLPDFEWAARNYMNDSGYTYYRNGAAGEWSYRNNLEAFSRFRLKPRVMVDITNIESTLK